jgi:hypothetical protein
VNITLRINWLVLSQKFNKRSPLALCVIHWIFTTISQYKQRNWHTISLLILRYCSEDFVINSKKITLPSLIDLHPYLCAISNRISSGKVPIPLAKEPRRSQQDTLRTLLIVHCRIFSYKQLLTENIGESSIK